MAFWHYVLFLVVVAIAIFFVSQNTALPTGFTVFELSSNSPSQGAADAKVTIVEFSDYQCPACLVMEQSIRAVLPEFEGKVRFVYRNYPLYTIHPNASIAAEAALAAGEQGKFWEMHEKLFDNQAQISAEGIAAIKRIAKEIGLDEAQFDEAISSRKFAAQVKKDMDDATRFGVEATPTFFINGQKYVGAYSAAQLRQLIESELAK